MQTTAPDPLQTVAFLKRGYSLIGDGTAPRGTHFISPFVWLAQTLVQKTTALSIETEKKASCCLGYSASDR
jgi:hypothetical protein